MQKERQIAFAFRILHGKMARGGAALLVRHKKIEFLSTSGLRGRLRILSPTGEPRGTPEEMGAALRDRTCLSPANGDGRLGVQEVQSPVV